MLILLKRAIKKAERDLAPKITDLEIASVRSIKHQNVLRVRVTGKSRPFADEAWADRFWVTFSLPIEILRSPDLPRIVAMFVESFVRFSDPTQAMSIA